MIKKKHTASAFMIRQDAKGADCGVPTTAEQTVAGRSGHIIPRKLKGCNDD
jgi:hypothetical protein